MSSAEKHFGSDKGSKDFYLLKPFASIFSQGVHDLAEGCKAYWLIEMIFKFQSDEKVIAEDYQSWQLIKAGKYWFVLTMNTPEKGIVICHDIALQIFDYDGAKLVMSNSCLMLPQEFLILKSQNNV